MVLDCDEIRDQYDSTNTDGGDNYSSNQVDKSLLNSELVRQIMVRFWPLMGRYG